MQMEHQLAGGNQLAIFTSVGKDLNLVSPLKQLEISNVTGLKIQTGRRPPLGYFQA